MTSITKNYNSIDPSDEIKASGTSFDQPNRTSSKISGLVDFIFKETKGLSFRNLGSSTYLVLDKEEAVIQKALKVSGWILGIIPSIVLALFLYERILELYTPNLYDERMDLYQQAQGYSRLEEYSDEELESNLLYVPKIVEIPPESPSTRIQDTPTPQERVQDERATERPKELPIETKDDTSETSTQESLESEIANSFEMVNYPTQEEMEQNPELLPSRIQQVREKEFSSKDFEILTPIIVDYTNTKIDITAASLDQIKRDLPRMNIFVNDTHCLNIQDFVSQFGLTLNDSKTDILPRYNSIIPKILYFSHQGIFSSGMSQIMQKIYESPNKLTPAQVKDVFPTIHINWNAESPEQTEIIAEVPFNIQSTDLDGTLLPYTYILRTKHFLDREEITFKIQEEAPSEPLIS